MKKLLINLIMILLLLVSTINHAQAKRERPKPPFKTVVESFDGEFTNFRETKSWELKNGELQFSGGDTTMSYLNYLDDDYSDFTISVKAKWTGRDSWSNFGLYFRGMEDEFYVFSISKEQSLNLSKHKGDKWEDLNPEYYSELIIPGINNLKVTCKGANIKCYINDKKVVDLIDDSFSRGKVGVYAFGNVTCAFDDFSITDVQVDAEGNLIKEDFAGDKTIFSLSSVMKVNDGTLFITTDKSEEYREFPQMFSDFTLTTKAKWTGKNKDTGYGILFNYENEKLFNWSYYIFVIAQSGFYALAKYSSSQEKWEFLSPWKKTNLVSAGYNDLKVTCIGNKVKCYINDKLIISNKDDSYKSGRVGIYISPNLDCTFDDIIAGPAVNDSLEEVYEETISAEPAPVGDNELITGGTYTEVVRENFDGTTTDFNLDSDWQLEDGELYYSSDNESSLARIRIKKSFTDCTVSLKTKWDGKEKDSAFGLRFGGDFAFFIAQDGSYKMSKWTGSEWINLVPWQDTDLISDDYNNLTVTCSGKNILAYLNNNLVINIQDDSYTGGYVGIACSGDVEAYFDDFIVIVPTKNADVNKNYNTITLKEESNNVILQDNFDGNTSVLRLDQYWKLYKSALAFTNGVPKKTYWTYTDNNFTDFSCTVNAIWTGKQNNLGYGLAFGINGNLTYAFDITQHGYYELSYWDGSKWNEIVPYKKSDLIKAGFNNLKVSCKNNQVICYINNVQVFDAKIDNYSGGRLGIFCCGEVEASFDDFNVSKNK